MNLRFLNSRKLINIIEMAAQLILQIYHRDNKSIQKSVPIFLLLSNPCTSYNLCTSFLIRHT